MRQLETQQATLRQQTQQIDKQAADLNLYLQNLERSRNYVDKEGRVVQGPLPPEYYNAQARQRELLNQRQAAELEASRLGGAIAQERARLPTPPYDGQVQPVGEDGVPVTLPPESSNPTAPTANGDDSGTTTDDASPDPATQPASDPQTTPPG